VLGGRIGLPWPDYDQPMRVQEAVSRSTGGYAGIFDPTAGTVAIAYYADDFVVLHEAAHAWFNGSLLADRWSNEAFASYYGALAAEDLELKVAPDRLTPELEKARIPLNGWGPVGTVDVTQEDYAYAASLALAREIAKRASPDGLKTVWADVSDRRSAYQPVGGGDEIVGGPVDWRGLLDLLETRSDATFDDLWRTGVTRPEDIPLLDARLAARTRYDAFLETVGGWHVPLSIRDAMRSWRFNEANALIDGAASVIELRAEVEAAAGMAGLTAPASLRSAFEDDDGFDDAMAEGDAELLAVERYVAAVSQRPAAMTPLMTLGLWGETPEDDLLAAKGAFAAGDLATSTAAADEAAASWTNAESMGQGRAFSIGTIVISLLFILSLMIVTFRRRRRRRVRMQATRLRT
jgi:cbb3-type cytochrome oxidase subunit 3